MAWAVTTMLLWLATGINISHRLCPGCFLQNIRAGHRRREILTPITNHSNMAVAVHAMPQDLISYCNRGVGMLRKRADPNHRYALGVVGYEDGGHGATASKHRRCRTNTVVRGDGIMDLKGSRTLTWCPNATLKVSETLLVLLQAAR